MKLNLSILISTVTLIIGLVFLKSLIFIPASVVIASIIDLSTREWVNSNRLGSMTRVSVLLKFVFSLIGFYGTIGQFICLGLLIKWFLI